MSNHEAFIKRGSNYVTAHGGYISDWSIEVSGKTHMVFHRVLKVSRTVARAMLQEALASNCDGYPEDMYGCEKWTDGEGEINRPKPEHWMDVGNKDFVVLNFGEELGLTMTVLYNHDGKYTVYRGNIEDVKRYIIERQKMIPDTFKRMLFGNEEIPAPPPVVKKVITDAMIEGALKVLGPEQGSSTVKLVKRLMDVHKVRLVDAKGAVEEYWTRMSFPTRS